MRGFGPCWRLIDANVLAAISRHGVIIFEVQGIILGTGCLQGTPVRKLNQFGATYIWCNIHRVQHGSG